MPKHTPLFRSHFDCAEVTLTSWPSIRYRHVMPIEPTPLRDPSAVEGAAGRTLFVRSSVPIPPHAGRACTPPLAALTAVCCAQLGTVLLTLPLRDRLLTARVTPDERANRPTTTTQSCGRSRRRAGTPRVREGGPPCRRRCQSRLLRDHPPLFTSYATAAVPSASAVPFPS